MALAPDGVTANLRPARAHSLTLWLDGEAGADSDAEEDGDGERDGDAVMWIGTVLMVIMMATVVMVKRPMIVTPAVTACCEAPGLGL